MERIWAPWRIDYILGEEKEPGCIFCTKPSSDEDDANLIVHRAQGAFTMMNKFPYNNGHVMVSPYRQCLAALSSRNCNDSIRLSIRLRTIMRPEAMKQGALRLHPLSIGLRYALHRL